MTDDRYYPVEVQGEWINRQQVQIHKALEILCSYAPGSLTIIKGGHEKNSAVSAKTHHGLGVVDYIAGDVKVKNGNKLGIVMFPRDKREGFGPHSHGVVDGDNSADPTAIGQVHDKQNLGMNGLTGRYRAKYRGYKMLVRPIFVYNGDLSTRYCAVPCHKYEQQTSKSTNLGPVPVGTAVKPIAVTKVGGVPWFLDASGACYFDGNFSKTPQGDLPPSTPPVDPTPTPEPPVPTKPPSVPPVQHSDKNATFRVADFNVNGGYDGSGLSWADRLVLIVKTILAAKPSVINLQEAHEERGEHKQILAELKRQAPKTNWVLYEGDGGNHTIVDGDKHKALAPAHVYHLPYARDYYELNLQHIASGIAYWTWNTHLIASDPSKGRSRADAAHQRTGQTKVIANYLRRLHRSIGGGDANDTDYSTGSLRQALRAIGHTDVRTHVKTVTNGKLNSHDGYKTNPNKSEWIDLLAVGDLAEVVEVGLVDSGKASDHNLIWATVTIK